MIDINQLKELIIIPSLKLVDLYSESATNLLLGTCLVESLGGSYIKQVSGPALGIYQMEPFTHEALWVYIRNNKNILEKVEKASAMTSANASPQRLIYDLRYATIMSRVFYYRISEKLPDSQDLEGLAQYWKKYYNTFKGKGSVDEFIKRYHQYVTRRN